MMVKPLKLSKISRNKLEHILCANFVCLKFSLSLGLGPEQLEIGSRKRPKSALKVQKSKVSKFHQFYSVKNTPRDTHKTRKPPFPQLETFKKRKIEEKQFSKFFE